MIHHNDTHDFRPTEFSESEHQRLRIAVRKRDGVETFTLLAHAFQIDRGKHGLEVTIYQEIRNAFNRKPVVQIFADWMSYDLDNMPGKGWSDLTTVYAEVKDIFKGAP